MRVANVITALVIFALGAGMAVDSWALGSGWGKSGPQAGFFPFWIGTLLALTAAALVVQAALTASPARRFLGRDQLARVAKVAVPAIGLVALIHFAGLYVAAAVYIAGYMRLIGRHDWRLVGAVSLGTSLLTFLVFEIWFVSPMPKGPIEVWLGF